MKNEINLRTREYEISRGFYLPRFLSTLAVVLLLALLVGGTLSVYLYQVKLRSVNEALLQEKAELQLAVAPLDQLEAQIAKLASLENLLKALESDFPPWSASYREIFRIAAATGPQVKTLSAGSGGVINIDGESPTMKEVALFTQALEQVPGGIAAQHRSMTYPSGGDRFHYDLELRFVNGGEQQP